jgi:cobalamin biosynthesis protein CobD/CbiB
MKKIVSQSRFERLQVVTEEVGSIAHPAAWLLSPTEADEVIWRGPVCRDPKRFIGLALCAFMVAAVVLLYLIYPPDEVEQPAIK